MVVVNKNSYMPLKMETSYQVNYINSFISKIELKRILINEYIKFINFHGTFIK